MEFRITTTCVDENKLWEESTLREDNPIWYHQVNIYPTLERQTFKGFGGAFTEASGYVFANLPDEEKEKFIEWYFGQSGLRYTLGRTHIGSCDFSLDSYSCVTDPEDTGLETFSMERDEKYILPLIDLAGRKAGRSMSVMLSPWSPPDFMKSSGKRCGVGYLLPEWAEQWAKCIARYVKEYRARGVDVPFVTVQNEPQAHVVWDTCIYTAEQEAAFVRDHLGPVFEREGLGDVDILVFDHNKDIAVNRVLTIMSDPGAAKYVKGVALHWYGGDHFEGISLLRAKYPQLDFYFTEGCVEDYNLPDASEVHKAEVYAHDILGNLEAGITGSIDWNLLLDAQGGPNHAKNYCKAPVMLCDDDDSKIERKLTYYYIGHFSRYIQPGAKSIGSSRFSPEIESTAFVNPDGERVVVLLNRNAHEVVVSVFEKDRTCCNLTLSGHSIATVRYY